MRTRFVLPILLSGILIALVPAAHGQDAAAYFQQNCASCHTIGGGNLTGPDLKGVTDRRDREWLTRWIQNPQQLVASGDPYARQLVAEFGGIVMPPSAGMTPALSASVLELLGAESKLPHSRFGGTRAEERPFTQRDVDAGRRLFMGAQALSAGGPSCISCHTIRGVSGLGGGRLGPDLTLAYERLQGRKGLTAWLTNPASATMAPVFAAKTIAPDEILALTAYFDDAARRGGQADASSALDFVLLGMGGAVVGLVALDVVWKKRFRGVRRALIQKSRGEE